LKTLIINFKNYSEILGEKAIELVKAAENAVDTSRVEVIVAPPHPMLGLISSMARIQVFSQSVSNGQAGATTGAVVPEAVLASGATGTLLNHSEAPMERDLLAQLLPRLNRLNLKVCLCAKSDREAQELSRLGPEYLAIEPPELIGSGVAVSTARPELVSTTVSLARGAGYTGKILCGAGIVSGDDVRKAVELGVDGVLVASSVVKAKSWEEKISEISAPLT
jgi:triosephosphate isomerase